MPRFILPAFLLFASVAYAADRPNVIIIYSDDQGFGDASCLNPEAKFQTPNLDRLAKEGITFTNGHSADSVCTPSRYALLTGRYAWRTRLKKGVMGAEGKCLIADGTATIASVLRDSGYATAMVGKWHLGMDFPGKNYKERDWTKPVRDMPLDKGFDYFFGIPASLNYGVLAWFEGRYAAVPPTVFTNKKPNERHVDYRIMPPYEETPAETKKRLGQNGMEVAPDFVDNECLTRFTDKAIDWMRSHHIGSRKSDPFFLYLPLTSPHYPVCPLPEFHGKGECGAYGEFVIETDHHVGRILEFLDSAGLDENTLIVYTSDNGPEKSWKQRIETHGHRSNYEYREGKRSVYEGGHRVPFFVRWPAGIANPGSRWSRPIGQVDLLATLAQLAGSELEDDQGVDSQSFATVLRNPVSNYQRTPLINHGVKGRFSITFDNWKLVMPHGNFSRELYNLETDPGETTNILKEHPDIATRLETQITEIVLGGRSRPGEKQANDTEPWKDLTWIE
ncbi:MAG: arylsulfatase [Planctomycetota bacterium]